MWAAALAAAFTVGLCWARAAAEEPAGAKPSKPHWHCYKGDCTYVTPPGYEIPHDRPHWQCHRGRCIYVTKSDLDRAKTLRKRVEAFKELAKQREAQKAAYRKQFNAAIAKHSGWGPNWPGVPNGWKDFSISPDMNNNPGAAMVHLLSMIDRVDNFSRHEQTEMDRMEKEIAKIEGRPDDGSSNDAQPEDAILEHVKPVKVKATTRVVDDLAGTTATTVIAFVFWNVGAKAKGYGKATGATVTTFAKGGSDHEKCVGVFSGGPNGTLHMSCGGEETTLQLSNGRTLTVVGEPGTLKVDNPEAFDNWPAGFD